MELKPGYKQTEVGVIPEEWEVVPLRDLERAGQLGLYRGRVISKKDIAREPGDYPIYSSSVHNDALFGRYGRFMFDQELITWSIDGGGDFFYRQKHRYSVTNVCGYMRVRNPSLNCRFLAYQLQSLHSRQTFDYTLKAHPSVIGGLYVVPIPPLPEQRAIAQALGDVDALIGRLEKLIAKQRDLKQAAMQQLLTGRTRLPGFSGEWEVKQLGEVAEIASGATPRTDNPAYWGGTIKWCTPTDITATPGKYLGETERTITHAGLSSCSARLLPPGSLLLCSRATIGELKIAATDVCTNQGFKSLVVREGASNEFLYYLLLTMKPQMVERAIGSTFLELQKKDAEALEVGMPPLGEQAAIATVLSDMDAEIAALEARLAKARDLKQGMMQELLTGRIRLV